ncbi:unnamed protein product [Sphagnum compactum]
MKRLFDYSIAIPQKCLRISSPKLYPAQNMSFVYFTMHFTLLKKLIYEAQVGGHVSSGASGAFPHIPPAPWKAPSAPCGTSLTDLVMLLRVPAIHLYCDVLNAVIEGENYLHMRGRCEVSSVESQDRPKYSCCARHYCELNSSYGPEAPCPGYGFDMNFKF